MSIYITTELVGLTFRHLPSVKSRVTFLVGTKGFRDIILLDAIGPVSAVSSTCCSVNKLKRSV